VRGCESGRELNIACEEEGGQLKREEGEIGT